MDSQAAGSGFQRKTGQRITDFARLDQLDASRKACNFCDLLCKAIRRYSQNKHSVDTSCSLNWEVDGREHGLSKDKQHVYAKSTRRIRVSWRDTTDCLQEVHVVFVAARDPARPNSDAMSFWTATTHHLGREFGDQKEKQALIKSWLDICEHSHSEACHNTHSTQDVFMALIRETYFGVIDVVDMQLKALPVENNQPARYVALSYVWGRLPHDELPYRTTRSNVINHIHHGGLEAAWDKLPQTIQDAILLVSRLGERYLWIDSLCIVQDSDTSWRLNAKSMHVVYGNAYFTICAADGDATTGLCAVHSSIRDARQTQPSPMVERAPAGMTPEDMQQTGVECAPGVRLMTTRPLEAVINDSSWNKRAWTFQERILSRRCLFFAEGRVYFQCRSTSFSQDIFADNKGSGWSLDRTNSPHRTLEELRQRPLWFYMKYVRLYTGRSLTKARDIMAAFEGITWLLGRYMDAASLSGLPTSHFDLCLLWMPQCALRRRRPADAAATTANGETRRTCTQDAMGNCTCHQEAESFGGDEFPSWSWSGWLGGASGYDADMIDGCLLNPHEWLKYHTWIQWYIRDARGHLRPMWKLLFRHMSATTTRTASEQSPFAKSGPSSLEDNNRWHGYPTRSEYRPSPVIQTDHYETRKSPERTVRTKHTSQRVREHIAESSDSQRTGMHRVSNSAYIRREQDSKSYMESDKRPTALASRTLESQGLKAPDDDPNALPFSDSYGRLIRPEIPHAELPFQSILPDNPFGVIRENYFPLHPSDVVHTPMLQFYTWAVDLFVSAREPADREGGDATQAEGGLCDCDIIDKEGDWCGSIVLPQHWIRGHEGKLCRFIAISDAKAFTPKECPVWTYYIPKEADESEWDLYFTLLLDRNDDRGVWERVGLGKVFQAAFSDKSWQEIKLG